MMKRLSFLSLLILLLLAACNTTAEKQEAAPAIVPGTGPVVEVFRSPT
ncbi:MAG: hypothetical protein HF973_14975 [Chloroflexi bacterium]|nr:hypothetical protein [Chloroflexota bacterium]